MNTDSSVMNSQCLAPPTSTSPSTMAVQQSQTSTRKQPTEKMECSSNPQHMPPLTKRYELSLKPREYQKELAQPGIEGKNYIVVAPTNSSKTLVAAMVITNHLEKNAHEKRPPKAVMVVKTRPLADQQTEQLLVLNVALVTVANFVIETFKYTSKMLCLCLTSLFAQLASCLMS